MLRRSSRSFVPLPGEEYDRLHPQARQLWAWFPCNSRTIYDITRRVGAKALTGTTTTAEVREGFPCVTNNNSGLVEPSLTCSTLPKPQDGFTFTGWIYYDTGTYWRTLLHLRQSDNNGIRFSLPGSGTNLAYTITGVADYTTNLNVNTGKWTFIAVTMHGTQALSYLGDITYKELSKHTQTISSSWSHTNVSQVTLLYNNALGGAAWEGSIKDFRVYTTAMSEGLIDQIYRDPWAPFSRRITYASAGAPPVSNNGAAMYHHLQNLGAY